MAPALLDGSEYVSRWINEVLNTDPDADDTTEDTGTSGLEAHLRRMKVLMNSADREMGRAPSDAVGFTKSEGSESKNVDRKDSIRNAFNSPMRPFVLATTSIGQEGLDFHHYCRKIMHWNLPSNPIDLEQREGRINRYKCLAIRQDIAERFADREFDSDVWQELFSMAYEEIRTSDQSELVPYWCLGKNQSVKIERIIPMYPVSKDEVNYDRLRKVLSFYRLTMGQARQEELVEYILESGMKDKEYIRNLFINLSPYIRTDEEWKERMSERKPVIEAKKKSERQTKIETLQSELDRCQEQMRFLTAEKDNIKTYEVIGMLITHKSFGELAREMGAEPTYNGQTCLAVGKGDFPFPFQTSDQIDELEVKSRMQAIDFYCKKCRKSMRISYALTGDRTAPAMNGIMIKCHTHKCTRVVTLKNFTEGQIVERTDALGKCYL